MRKALLTFFFFAYNKQNYKLSNGFEIRQDRLSVRKTKLPHVLSAIYIQNILTLAYNKNWYKIEYLS